MGFFMIEGAGWVSFAAAIACVLLAGGLAVKDRKSFANRCFIAGLALLSLIELFRGMSAQSILPQDMLYWQRARLFITALLPGTWFLFSLTFARAEYRTFLSRWRAVIIGLFAAPILIIVLYSDSLFSDMPTMDMQGNYLIPLGPPGKILQLILLLSAVLILANLERTLRASIGRIRWQIKFIVLALGALCTLWIFSASQALLYSSLNLSLGILNPIVLLCADGLFFWGIVRSRFLNVDVYLSRTTLQYSLTILLAGVYLIAIGLMAQLVRLLSPERALPVDALVVLLALMGLAVLMMSDRLQEQLKRVITRHFKRPRYDYRKSWMDLTERATSLSDIHELCTEVAKIISQTLGFLSVNIWLRDEGEARLHLCGSTVFTPAQAKELMREGDAVAAILSAVSGSVSPVDLTQQRFDWPEDIMRAKPEYFADYKMRYIAGVETGGQLVGIITLNNDRVGFAPLSIEDQDLLHAYTSQLAANVLQLRLSERLRLSKEMEAFQNVSAFFVHDLKNLASKLSLTMQNLPVHFENPEFRADALRVIGQSVTQMNEMCSRLSLLRQKIDLKPVRTNLNDLITRTLEGMEHGANGKCEKDLKPLPDVPADPEQMQKVITNLILNAHEALEKDGKIRIATEQGQNSVVLSVSDTGCGMTQDFIEKSLFQPFRSTKKKGMGIGLFHSKMIVEAHHGRIEVESKPGEGSVFRVVLPVKG